MSDQEAPAITDEQKTVARKRNAGDLKAASPRQGKIIEETVSSMIMSGVSLAPENTVMKKLTAEHISHFLDSATQEMNNTFAEKLHRKIFALVALLLVMAFFVALIILLRHTPEIMEKVIYATGGIIAGGFGGYGLGKRKKDD